MDKLIDHTRNVQKDLWSIEITEKGLKQKLGARKQKKRQSAARSGGSTPSWWNALSRDEQVNWKKKPNLTDKVRAYPVKSGGDKSGGSKEKSRLFGKKREKRRQGKLRKEDKTQTKERSKEIEGALKREKKPRKEKDPKKREQLIKRREELSAEHERATGEKTKEGKKKEKKKLRKEKGQIKRAERRTKQKKKIATKKEDKSKVKAGKRTSRQVALEGIRASSETIAEQKAELLDKNSELLDDLVKSGALDEKGRADFEKNLTKELDDKLQAADKRFKKMGGDKRLSKLEKERAGVAGEKEAQQKVTNVAEEAKVNAEFDALIKGTKDLKLDINIPEQRKTLENVKANLEKERKEALKQTKAGKIRTETSREAQTAFDEQKTAEAAAAEKERIEGLVSTLESSDLSPETKDEILYEMSKARLDAATEAEWVEEAKPIITTHTNENNRLTNEINTVNKLPENIFNSGQKNQMVTRLENQKIDIPKLTAHLHEGGTEQAFMDDRNVSGASTSGDKPERQALDKVKSADYHQMLPEDWKLISSSTNEGVQREAADDLAKNLKDTPKDWLTMSEDNKKAITDFAKSSKHQILEGRITQLTALSGEADEARLRKELGLREKFGDNNPDLVSKLMELQKVIMVVPNRESMNYKLTELQTIVAKGFN